MDFGESRGVPNKLIRAIAYETFTNENRPDSYVHDFMVYYAKAHNFSFTYNNIEQVFTITKGE